MLLVVVACSFGRTTIGHQATLTTVQEAGLLVLVLKYLESLEDIFSCSAVSKRWHCACQHIQPSGLILPGRSSRLDEDGMMSVLRWIQNKQKQGALQIKVADLTSLGHGHVFNVAFLEQEKAALNRRSCPLPSNLLLVLGRRV